MKIRGENMLTIIEDLEQIKESQKQFERVKDSPDFATIKNVIIGYLG